ncbi:hypothetical protein HPB51_010879 [Rhipicephalus microplus]|uniref:Uncharacterized protein n=1 Tax=Rhipicephalus microplus TaxID=6941 RepID=A0A9J6DM00_RHIMP|nr:hypothetical protein HPB51_010879 [Rhipicephalus microplus]
MVRKSVATQDGQPRTGVLKEAKVTQRVKGVDVLPRPPGANIERCGARRSGPGPKLTALRLADICRSSESRFRRLAFFLAMFPCKVLGDERLIGLPRYMTSSAFDRHVRIKNVFAWPAVIATNQKIRNPCTRLCQADTANCGRRPGLDTRHGPFPWACTSPGCLHGFEAYVERLPSFDTEMAHCEKRVGIGLGHCNDDVRQAALEAHQR